MDETKDILIPQPHGGALTSNKFRGGRPKGKMSRAKISRLVLQTKAYSFFGGHWHALKDKYPGIEEKATVEEVMTIVQAHKAILKQDTNAYTALINNAYQPLERHTQGASTYIFTSNIDKPTTNEQNHTVDAHVIRSSDDKAD